MVLNEENASGLVELKENRRIEITVWGQNKTEYSKKLEVLIDSQLKEYRFTAHKEERQWGGKAVKFITLLFEAAAKGVTSAMVSGIIKP